MGVEVSVEVLYVPKGYFLGGGGGQIQLKVSLAQSEI